MPNKPTSPTIKNIDEMLESFKGLNALWAITAISIAAYSEEMLASGAFTNEEILAEYNHLSPAGEQIDTRRINQILSNRKLGALALSNLRATIFRETIIYIHELAARHFKEKDRFGVIRLTKLWEMATLIRNAVAHLSVDCKRPLKGPRSPFDKNGKLQWNGITINRDDLQTSRQFTSKIINRINTWKVITGLRDAIALDCQRASLDDLASFCNHK